jgi:hypothetical protein
MYYVYQISQFCTYNMILINFMIIYLNLLEQNVFLELNNARTYLQLPLRQWGAGNVYLLVLSSWKVNIAENLIAVMGL